MGIKILLCTALGISIVSGNATGAFALMNEDVCPENHDKPYACVAEWGYVGEDPYDMDRFSTVLRDGSKHGCTSFDAFMLALYNEWMPPISTFNSARFWDTDATTRTAATISGFPKVGDIAQWNATEKLEYGHVAYVKTVVKTFAGDIQYIIVADDNGGRLATTQRKLYPGVMYGTISWPDNFITFPKASDFSSGGGFLGNEMMRYPMESSYE